MARRYFIYLGLVLLVAVIAGIVWRHSPPRQVEVTHDQLLLIHRGMTRTQVEAIIGAPPGDYASARYQYSCQGCEGSTCDLFNGKRWKAKDPSKVHPSRPDGKMSLWWTEDYLLAIEFDGEDKVRFCGYGFACREPTVMERLSNWLFP